MSEWRWQENRSEMSIVPHETGRTELKTKENQKSTVNSTSLTKSHIRQKCYHIKSPITHFLFDIESRRACKTMRRTETDETAKSKQSAIQRPGTKFGLLRIVVCEDVESLQFFSHFISFHLSLRAEDYVATKGLCGRSIVCKCFTIVF
jgi:hypothetical protein